MVWRRLRESAGCGRRKTGCCGGLSGMPISSSDRLLTEMMMMMKSEMECEGPYASKRAVANMTVSRRLCRSALCVDVYNYN